MGILEFQISRAPPLQKCFSWTLISRNWNGSCVTKRNPPQRRPDIFGGFKVRIVISLSQISKGDIWHLMQPVWDMKMFQWHAWSNGLQSRWPQSLKVGSYYAGEAKVSRAAGFQLEKRMIGCSTRNGARLPEVSHEEINGNKKPSSKEFYMDYLDLSRRFGLPGKTIRKKTLPLRTDVYISSVFPLPWQQNQLQSGWSEVLQSLAVPELL